MRILPTMLAALALSTAVPALAADENGPSFQNGTVWDFADIKTTDGHFDDYMSWLAGPWKQQQEALKKAGYILSYKVLLVSDPRHGEPDIILATEYANMAAFDRSTTEVYATMAKVIGPLPKAAKEQADRGAIRTVLGDTLAREAILK
jgi:hypothetical protein